jgi:hypothetical protein
MPLDGEGEIEWINVSPKRRGRDIACELTTAMDARFVAVEAVPVGVDVDPGNEVARSFCANRQRLLSTGSGCSRKTRRQGATGEIPLLETVFVV